MKAVQDSRVATELQRLAIEAARAGAQAIDQTIRLGGPRITYKDSGTSSPVTDADKASERAICALITEHRPHDAIRTEESPETDGDSGFRWIIDPLDGTVNFSHGMSRYAVSIAAETCEEGRIVAAAVLRPATGQLLALSGTKVVGTGGVGVTNVPAAAALLAFAVPNDPPTRRATYQMLADIGPRVQDLRNFGSTVCDLATVAAGQFDGFISVNPASWDIAAGVALVTAAGGTSKRWRRPDGLDVLVVGGETVVAAVAGWLDR